MRSNLSRVLIIGALAGLGGILSMEPPTELRKKADSKPRTSREPYRYTPTQRWRRYPGQSPEAAKAALDAAAAKRARRIARNKRIAGEAV